MKKEHVQAGTEVVKGVYQCNACANEHEVKDDESKLPPCSVCDSISWRVFRVAADTRKSKT